MEEASKRLWDNIKEDFRNSSFGKKLEENSLINFFIAKEYEKFTSYNVNMSEEEGGESNDRSQNDLEFSVGVSPKVDLEKSSIEAKVEWEKIQFTTQGNIDGYEARVKVPIAKFCKRNIGIEALEGSYSSDKGFSIEVGIGYNF